MYREIFDHLADKKVATAVGTRTSDISLPLSAERAKTLGAFNTDGQVADFLVGWAVRSRQDTVIDPSFGEGVFLHAACKRLTELGGEPSLQVYGVEVDAGIHARVARRLSDGFGLQPGHLLVNDFFSIEPATLRVDAVVGNPPFIRYQRFTGETRRIAIMRAAAQGVSLTKLSSSWAPFLVHSVSLLNKGGRLAMVAPVELCHAAYARPVLTFLARSFGSVTLATFRNKLFPHLSEDTLLILADDKGAVEHRMLWRDFGHANELVEAGCISVRIATLPRT